MRWDDRIKLTPHNEDERKAMIAFHKLEQQCDAENAVEVLAIRDSGELKKGQVVQINAAMKRWYKETSSAIRRLTPSSKNFIGYSSMAHQRTWLKHFNEA